MLLYYAARDVYLMTVNMVLKNNPLTAIVFRVDSVGLQYET